MIFQFIYLFYVGLVYLIRDGIYNYDTKEFEYVTFCMILTYIFEAILGIYSIYFIIQESAQLKEDGLSYFT